MTGPGRVVHLGAGAFARGHTWWCTDRAARVRDEPWRVTAVAQRRPDVVAALRANGWRYHVVRREDARDRVDRVDVVSGGLVAAREPEGLVRALADPEVTVVTITATEAGYPHHPDGSLRAEDPAVRADLADGTHRTLVAQVVAAAAARDRAGAGPVAFVACDNVLSAGRLLRSLALAYADRAGARRAAGWLAANATFPDTVVDRIVPAVGPAVRRRLQRIVGEEDGAVVGAEAFFRWVIEDDFPVPRPPWEAAGATLTADVTPWQHAKLRLVNAPHSLVAYLGLALGHRTTRAATADPIVRAALTAALDEAFVPSVPPAPGLDPRAEAATSVARFGNTAIAHPLAQIGADGAAKLRQRMSGLRAAPAHRWVALTAALWGRALERGQVTDADPAVRADALPSGDDARARTLARWAGLDRRLVPAVAECAGRLRRDGVVSAVPAR